MANFNINHYPPQKIKKIKNKGPYLPERSSIIDENGMTVRRPWYLASIRGELPSGCVYKIGTSMSGNWMCWIYEIYKSGSCSNSDERLITQAIIWDKKTRSYSDEYQRLRSYAW